MTLETVYYDWSQDKMLEVTLDDPEAFLKIKETLTRIGVTSKTGNTLYQSCHILHKQGRYYIVHFKELFALDGKENNLTVNDVERRNAISSLLQDWGLLKIINPSRYEVKAPLNQIKILPYKEKSNWELVPKYTIGKVKVRYDNEA